MLYVFNQFLARLYGSTVMTLPFSFVLLRSFLAISAASEVLYLTKAVGRTLPKSSISIRHFYNDPFSQNTFYTSHLSYIEILIWYIWMKPKNFECSSLFLFFFITVLLLNGGFRLRSSFQWKSSVLLNIFSSVLSNIGPSSIGSISNEFSSPLLVSELSIGIVKILDDSFAEFFHLNLNATYISLSFFILSFLFFFVLLNQGIKIYILHCLF